MTELRDMLPLTEKRSQMLDDCCTILDLEVGKKKGFSGFAVKAGYAVMKSIKPGAVRHAIDGLMDEFIDELGPLHQEYQKSKPNESFGQYMKSRTNQVANLLVNVTDKRAQHSQHTALKKIYKKLRPHALRSVEDAAPALADLMDRYYKTS